MNAAFRSWRLREASNMCTGTGTEFRECAVPPHPRQSLTDNDLMEAFFDKANTLGSRPTLRVGPHIAERLSSERFCTGEGFALIMMRGTCFTIPTG